MRGSVLNRRGEFNRCSLTRLGIDAKWEEERWRKSLESRKEEDLVIETLQESKKTKRGTTSKAEANSKRRKVEVEGRVWGESLTVQQQAIDEFLAAGRGDQMPLATQSRLQVLSGMSWVAHQLVKEVANVAVDNAWECNLAATWEVWNGDDHALIKDSLPVVHTQPSNVVPVKKKSKYVIPDNQRSVRCFFSPKPKPDSKLRQQSSSHDDDGPWLDCEVLTEAELNKMYYQSQSLCKNEVSVSGDMMSKVCVIPDEKFKIRQPVQPISEGVKSAESKEVCIIVEPRLETLSKQSMGEGACPSVCVEAGLRKYVLPAKENYADMRKSLKTGTQIRRNSDIRGGEGRGGVVLNSTGEGGAIRQFENTFSSPNSKKIITKNKSVAELNVLFSSKEGGRGQNNQVKGAKIRSNQENIHINSVCCEKPKQNWHQKLQQFRAPGSEVRPENNHTMPQ